MAKLTPKQQRFCEEYLVDFNGAQAAIRAGYSKKAAKEQAARLLTNANAQIFISEKQTERRKGNEVTAQMVIAELVKIGMANVQDFVNGGNSVLELKGLPSEKTAAVSSVKTTINENTGAITTELKLHNKVSALEMLGKHFGIFEKDNAQSRSDVVVHVSAQEAQDISKALEGEV